MIELSNSFSGNSSLLCACYIFPAGTKQSSRYLSGCLAISHVSSECQCSSPPAPEVRKKAITPLCKAYANTFLAEADNANRVYRGCVVGGIGCLIAGEREMGAPGLNARMLSLQ
jgi:hypothetical protein